MRRACCSRAWAGGAECAATRRTIALHESVLAGLRRQLTFADEIASSADAEMAAAVASILGTLRVGEASATVGKLTTRQQGSFWTVLLVLVFGGWIAGLGTSFLLSNGGSPSYGTGGLLGVMIGAATFLLILGPLTRVRFQKNFQARQHTSDLPFRMEISSDHLIYEVGGVTQLANWARWTSFVKAMTIGYFSCRPTGCLRQGASSKALMKRDSFCEKRWRL